MTIFHEGNYLLRGAKNLAMRSKLILTIWVLTMMTCCDREDPVVPYISPEIQTIAASEITSHSAIIGGEIIKPGNEPITKKGFCWLPSTPEALANTVPMITDNVIEITDQNPKFTFSMNKLGPNQTIVYRAFVQNAIGVVYGQKLHFTTEFETITDIDGNVYRIWKIGDQTWTIDNYNVTHLRDGTPIPNRTEDSYWFPTAPQEPAMCWYDNNRAKYEKDYGALYNWYAASHPLIAPEGWRVPTISDYDTLAFYLMKTYPTSELWAVGGLCKTEGFDYWNPPNTGATNKSGFSAKAGGFRFRSGKFQAMGYEAVFNCSSEIFGYAETFLLTYNDYWFNSTLAESKFSGYSLRLIKDD